MLIYILIATFLYLGFFIDNKYHNVYYMLSLTILFLFSAVRNINLGGYDAENYQYFFYYLVPNLTNIFNYDMDYGYGYALFNSLIKTIVPDYKIYQIIYSALSIYLLHLVVKKLEFTKRERNLFLFIYFCYRFLWNNFVLLRQNIAVLIFWIALLTLLEKPLKYYFNVLITWLWHKTAIINIFFYPIIKIIKRIKPRKMLIITFLLSILLLLFSKPVFNFGLNLILGFIGPKYSKYLLVDVASDGNNIINYLLRWFFLLLFFSQYKKINNTKKEILLNISFFVIILGSINVAIVSRMVEYFMISFYAIIPLIHQGFQGKEKLLYVVGLYFMFLIILIRFLLTFSGGELLDYSTFFSM